MLILIIFIILKFNLDQIVFLRSGDALLELIDSKAELRFLVPAPCEFLDLFDLNEVVLLI
jgi:hypothetical protein